MAEIFLRSGRCKTGILGRSDQVLFFFFGSFKSMPLTHPRGRALIVRNSNFYLTGSDFSLDFNQLNHWTCKSGERRTPWALPTRMKKKKRRPMTQARAVVKLHRSTRD
jgi:hypothetical protein